jgi:hypothetical protein
MTDKIITGGKTPIKTKQQEVNLGFNVNLDELINKSIADGVQPEYIAESLYLRVLSVFQSNAHNEEFIKRAIEDFANDLLAAVKLHKEKVANPNG